MNSELKVMIEQDQKEADALLESLANIRQEWVNGEIDMTPKAQKQLEVLQARYDRLKERIERNTAELNKGEQV